jgi:hypothetical protein
MKNRNSLLSSIGLVLLLVTSSLAINVDQYRSALKTEPLIAPIADQGLVSGCGCSFHFPSDSQMRTVFGSNMDESHAWMNINGRDVKLRLIRSTHPRNERVGSRTSETYQALSIKVSAVLVTTRMCGPLEEDCEVTNYEATFTVTKGKHKKTLRLIGGCGC